MSGTPHPHPDSIIVTATSSNKPGLIKFIGYFVGIVINYFVTGD